MPSSYEMEARIDIVTNAKLAAGGWPLSAGQQST